MRYRQLGDSDLNVSEISLGSWLTYGGGVGNDAARAFVTFLSSEAAQTVFAKFGFGMAP